MRRFSLHLLFAVSGATGLVYQVAWVRQFARVFGGSVHSAAAVTAIFLGGLGLGGWLAGRWADAHPHRALGAYGVLEWAIGLLGGLVAVGIPALLPLSAATSWYTLSAEGWSVLSTGSIAARVALAAVVLGPSAACMGATLTLLIRDQVRTTGAAGWRVGWLYGLNTLGAAAGALATDLWLLPLWGLWGTQMSAAGANIAVGTLALLLARQPRPSLPTQPSEAPTDLLPVPQVGLALFAAGVASMGLEMTWFRFLAGSLGPYRAVFSVLLATVLTGIALGALAGGWAHRRWGRPALLFAIAQAAVVTSSLTLLATYDPYALLERQHAVAQAYAQATGWRQALVLHGLNGGTIARLVLVPSVAMGASFPLGNALAQGAASRVGQAAGGLYLATTAGNVFGSLMAGFWWLPVLGIQATAALSAVAALTAAVVCWRPSPGWWTANGVGLLAVAGFVALPANHVLWLTFPHGRAQDEGVLEIREGLEQIVVVTGYEEGPARLWTSGHPMTSTSPHAQRYMRLMAHLPLLLQDSPQRALVICVGAANTVHAASLHPSITRVDAVDLSPDVLAVNHWFSHSNQGVLTQDKTRVFVNDGRQHLLMQPPGSYDLITLEPPPLAVAGVSNLYSREFYALAASRLTDHGIVAQWLPAYQVPEQAVLALVRAFVDVFDGAVMVVGSGRELILIGGPGGVEFDPEQVRRRLEASPLVHQDLQRLGLPDEGELAATFAAGPDTLRSATASTGAVTDDRPLLEHAQQSHLMTTTLPASLFDTTGIASWCPECEGRTLDSRLQVSQATLTSPAFLAYSSLVPDLTSILPPPSTDDHTLATIAASDSLTRVLHAPDDLALRAVALWEAGDTQAALLHLQAARTQAPGIQTLDDLWERMNAEPDL